MHQKCNAIQYHVKCCITVLIKRYSNRVFCFTGDHYIFFKLYFNKTRNNKRLD